MKKPLLAFLFSFLLPGAGLWYLGKWAWGFINLGIVVVGITIIALSLPTNTYRQNAHTIAIAFAAASGAVARIVTEGQNRRLKNN